MKIVEATFSIAAFIGLLVVAGMFVYTILCFLAGAVPR